MKKNKKNKTGFNKGKSATQGQKMRLEKSKKE